MTGDRYGQIAAFFHRRIDTIAAAVDLMAPGLEAASQLLTRTVLDDGKILVCAGAADAELAEHLAARLRTPSEAAPALPAIAFHGDDALASDTPLWRDLRSLSRDGDVILCLDSSSGAGVAQQTAQFASGRNLHCILLSELADAPPAVCVIAQADSRPERAELLLAACHCLQEEIRQLLLGE